MPAQIKLPIDPDALVDVRQVQEVIPVTRMTLWRWERDGRFPTRIHLHNGRVYWRASEVREWLQSQTAA